MRWPFVGVLTVALACLMGAAAMAAEAGPKKAKKGQAGMLRHVVLFQFIEGTSPEDVKKVEDGFRALPSKIPQIVDFEWGTNNSPEGLSDGFTHCFLVTFKSAKDRDAYLPHPAHKAFVEVLKPFLKRALAVDYEVKK